MCATLCVFLVVLVLTGEYDKLDFGPDLLHRPSDTYRVEGKE